MMEPRLLPREIEFPPGVVGTFVVGKVCSSVVYVLEGCLQFEAGRMNEVLEAGDCVCLDSEMLITWGACGAVLCRALVVTPAE